MVEHVADPSAVVVVLSDTVAAGDKSDTAGKAVVEALEDAGFRIEGYEVIPEDDGVLATSLGGWLERRPNVIVTVGGTGVGPRDRTVETVQPMLTMEIPGIMEAARAYGQARTPFAMLSRGVAGLIDATIVITAPGSRGGATETMEAILDGLKHLVDVVHVKFPHEGGYE